MRLVLLAVSLLLSTPLHAAVQLLPDEKVDTASEVGAINQNFQTLDSNKVDKKPNYSLFPAPGFRYKRPVLTRISVTTVDVEANTENANETAIVFRDGEIRRVTENTGSTSLYRRFIITENAQFTSGTENSGLRPTYVEASNTWYAVYAVKSQIDASKFVLVGDTVTPVATNFAALNTAYGTNGWVHLNYIRNGSGRGDAPSDILAFSQSGDFTVFSNNIPAANMNCNLSAQGVAMGGAGSAVSFTYTFTSGTGNSEIPPTVKNVLWSGQYGPVAGFRQFQDFDSGAFLSVAYDNGNNGIILRVPTGNHSVQLRNGPGSSICYDLLLSGFWDSALSGPF